MNKQTAPLETVLEVAAEMITSREMTVALLVELAEARLQERFLGERINELRAEYNYAVKMADEDEARFERICDEKNRELEALVAAIDAERESYARTLARREQEITDVRNMLDEMTDRHWKFVNNCPPGETPAVAAMVGGAILEAAEVYRDTGNKISAIKRFRERTGLGLHESVLIVRDQIAAVVDWKEATVE